MNVMKLRTEARSILHLPKSNLRTFLQALQDLGYREGFRAAIALSPGFAQIPLENLELLDLYSPPPLLLLPTPLVFKPKDLQ